MNKTISFYSISLGAILIIIYTFYSADTENFPSESSQFRNINLRSSNSQNSALVKQKLNLEQDVKALQAEVTEMHLAINKLVYRLNSLPLSLASSTTVEENYQPSEIDQEQLKAANERIKKEGKERYNEKLFLLEDNFTAESIDTNWADEKTGVLQTTFNSLPAEINQGIELKATECRSSTCRIEVEFYDEPAQNDFEIQLPTVMGENFPRLSVKHEQYDGITKGIYFLQSE